MDIHGISWTFMNVHEVRTFFSMEIHGLLLTSMVVNEFSWIAIEKNVVYSQCFGATSLFMVCYEMS